MYDSTQNNKERTISGFAKRSQGYGHYVKYPYGVSTLVDHRPEDAATNEPYHVAYDIGQRAKLSTTNFEDHQRSSEKFGQGSFGTQQLTQKGASHPDEFGQRAKLSTTNFEDDQRSSEKFGTGNTSGKYMKIHQKIANIIHDIEQFRIHNVFLLENKKNMIMDGKFTKIIYSDHFFILYGIFLKIFLFVDGVTTNGVNGNKYFFKFQPNHTCHEHVVNEIINIEYRILEFYKETFNVKKKSATILRNQIYNGCVKLFKNNCNSYSTETNTTIPRISVPNENFGEGSIGTQQLTTEEASSSPSLTQLSNSEIFTGKNNVEKYIYPRKIHFLLKISGIWEDNESIGLTYKFEIL
jgi:hypothetical protein